MLSLSSYCCIAISAKLVKNFIIPRLQHTKAKFEAAKSLQSLSGFLILMGAFELGFFKWCSIKRFRFCSIMGSKIHGFSVAACLQFSFRNFQMRHIVGPYFSEKPLNAIKDNLQNIYVSTVLKSRQKRSHMTIQFHFYQVKKI